MAPAQHRITSFLGGKERKVAPESQSKETKQVEIIDLLDDSDGEEAESGSKFKPLLIDDDDEDDDMVVEVGSRSASSIQSAGALMQQQKPSTTAAPQHEVSHDGDPSERVTEHPSRRAIVPEEQKSSNQDNSMKTGKVGAEKRVDETSTPEAVAEVDAYDSSDDEVDAKKNWRKPPSPIISSSSSPLLGHRPDESGTAEQRRKRPSTSPELQPQKQLKPCHTEQQSIVAEVPRTKGTKRNRPSLSTGKRKETSFPLKNRGCNAESISGKNPTTAVKHRKRAITSQKSTPKRKPAAQTAGELHRRNPSAAESPRDVIDMPSSSGSNEKRTGMLGEVWNRHRNISHDNCVTCLSEYTVFEEADILGEYDECNFKLEKENPLDTMFGSTVVKSSYKTDEHGFPIQFITLYHGSDSTLYDIQINVGRSTITSGGRGAFLTYLGARELNGLTYEKYGRLASEGEYRVTQLQKPLEAVLPHDFRVSVKLLGRNLDGNYGCQYYPSTTRELYAVSQAGKDVRVVLKGEGVSYFSELKRKPRLGIGSLGLYTEADFTTIPDAALPADVLFLVGAYAPLSGTDRKISSLFDTKNWVFGLEPGEWPFGVSEKLRGSAQILDITDDVTGEPHTNAQKRIPMYVNEVGYDLARKQNVFIANEDDRSVHYYFTAGRNLQKGDKIELLTDYGDLYETNRERQGYGLKSIFRQDKCDKHKPSRMMRELQSRSDVVDILEKAPFIELLRIVEHLTTKTWEPLLARAKKKQTLSRIQIRSVIRTSWLARLLEALVDKHVEDGSRKQVCYQSEELLRQCARHIDSLLQSWESVLLPRYLTNEDKDIFEDEIAQEALYLTRQKLKRPLCASTWCPLSRKLLCDITKAVSDCRLNDKVGFLSKVMAKHAKAAIRCFLDDHRNPTKLDQFSFAPMMSSVVSIPDLKESYVLGEALFTDHSILPKSVHATALSIAQGTSSDRDTRKVCSKMGYVVVAAPSVPKQSQETQDHLLSCVRTLQEGDAIVPNLHWYCTWQIAYVVDTLAAAVLPRPQYDWIMRSLQNELPDARFDKMIACARNHGMAISDNALFLAVNAAAVKARSDAFCNIVKTSLDASDRNAAAPQTLRNKVTRAPKPLTAQPRNSPEKIYEGPPTVSLPDGVDWPKGWFQRTYKRQSGHSKGGTDHYFFSPVVEYKLRSKIDVIRFLLALEKYGNEEEAAKKFRRS